MMVEASLVNTVQTVGILAGIAIALWQIREMNKTRRLQMIQEIWDWMSSEEGYHRLGTLLQMEWTDLEDFMSKYGVTSNLDNYAMRWSAMAKLNGLGYLVNEGAIDLETVYDHSGPRVIWLWVKFEPIIKELRKSISPEMLNWWEYLVKNMMIEMEKRGDTLTSIPAGYSRTNR
jgi:hypothetical protein